MNEIPHPEVEVEVVVKARGRTLGLNPNLNLNLRLLTLALLACACAGRRPAASAGPAVFPLRPPKSMAAGGAGTLQAVIQDGKLTADRQTLRLKVDGVPVTVAFAVASIEHPQRTLGYSGVTHEYDMKLLRHMHGYLRDPQGRYFWDDDSDEAHHHLAPLDDAKGRELDAFLQRNLELWVDRAMTLMLVDLEGQLKER